MGGVVHAIGNIVGGVAHAIGHAVSDVGHAVKGVVESAIHDPLGTIAKIGTAVFAPEFLPLVSAADSAAHGANIGQILTSAATSYAGGQVMSNFGNAANSASPGIFSDAVNAAKGITGDISDATGISQVTLNSGFGNAALSAGKAALMGGDPLQAAINSGVGTGISSGINDLTGYDIKLPMSSPNTPNLSGLSSPQMATYMGAMQTAGATPASAYAQATNTLQNAQGVAPVVSRSGEPITTTGAPMSAPEIYSSIDPATQRYNDSQAMPGPASSVNPLQLDQSIANGTPVPVIGQSANNANLAGYAKGGLAHFAAGGLTTDSSGGEPASPTTEDTDSPLGGLFSDFQKHLKEGTSQFASHPQNMLNLVKPPNTYGSQAQVMPGTPLLNLDQARHFQFHAQGGGIHTDPKIEGVSGLGSLHDGGNAAYHYKGAPDDHKPEFITGATGYHVQGKGTGQSDDIPAMLADGEYVFDADTVSALGDGSNKAGAEVLNKMREALREHKRSAPNDKIPPKAKTPLEYMKKALKG